MSVRTLIYFLWNAVFFIFFKANVAGTHIAVKSSYFWVPQFLNNNLNLVLFKSKLPLINSDALKSEGFSTMHFQIPFFNDSSIFDDFFIYDSSLSKKFKHYSFKILIIADVKMFLNTHDRKKQHHEDFVSSIFKLEKIRSWTLYDL